MSTGSFKERGDEDDCWPAPSKKRESIGKIPVFSYLSLSLELLKDVQLVLKLSPRQPNPEGENDDVDYSFDPKATGIWSWISAMWAKVWNFLQYSAVAITWISFSSSYLS